MDQNNNTSMITQYSTPFDVDKNSKSIYSSVSFFQKVSSLPDSIKDIMANPSTAEFIEDDLGPNFKLIRGQIIEITRIIRDILLGDASLNSMPNLISSKLGIDKDASIQIMTKILDDLFGPAIEDIKKLQVERFSEKISKPAAAIRPQIPKTLEKPDLRIESDINRNNIVDLRNR